MDKKYQELVIFRPCISNKISQHFGENKACTYPNGKIVGKKSTGCPAGSIDFYKSIGMHGHNGNDIGGFTGEEIYHAATFPGWWMSEHDYDGGLGVDIVSNEPLFFPFPIPTELINTAVPHVQNGIHGFTHYVKMRYWHLSKQVGHEKKQITCGTTIGLMGNTGASSATHLHFAPKWCLPDGRGVGQVNGYFGAFDPKPYYNNRVTAREHSDMLTKEAKPLTAQERKDIAKAIGTVQMVILALQKIIHKI